MPRKKKYSICLTDEEYTQASEIISSRSLSSTVCMRCQILLDLDEVHGFPLTYNECAEKNHISPNTVATAVRLYCTEGFGSVICLKRNANSDTAKLKADSRMEDALISLALSPPPAGHERWTLTLLEEECRRSFDIPVSKDTIKRAFDRRSFDLKNLSFR